ncbi:MAG: hypothetical protein RL693_1856 [Verrucomicrobiota bacterium]
MIDVGIYPSIESDEDGFLSEFLSICVGQSPLEMSG